MRTMQFSSNLSNISVLFLLFLQISLHILLAERTRLRQEKTVKSATVSCLPAAFFVKDNFKGNFLEKNCQVGAFTF